MSNSAEASIVTVTAACRAVELPGRGRGIVARRPIAVGEFVLAFRGSELRFQEVTEFTHVLEYAPGRFLGPSGELDDLVNHSCDPNCAVETNGRAALLRAVRPIRRGEELTFDYSTAMLTDPTTFPCQCGANGCRGIVRRWSELPSSVRGSYLRRGMVPAFVARPPARPRRR
ncbi:MAG TPA: SET domain-containing protein-lysine N-methyltransferase [Candidatus Polarisedimenticolaceae bacterium]|nr:SET domain-containing protein-lysine N-methyltransferase [Candidatus Polarisedimenticolaceae bacterium]